jgi:hypothetical protein
VRDLEWQANLNAGGNRLTLPVRLQGAEGGGEILIEVEHEGARKTFRVPVQSRPAGGAATDPIQKT